jgi:non-homologous end joining protein Ku
MKAIKDKLNKLDLGDKPYSYNPDTMGVATYKVLNNTIELMKCVGFNVENVNTRQKDSMYYNLLALNELYKIYNNE